VYADLVRVPRGGKLLIVLAVIAAALVAITWSTTARASSNPVINITLDQAVAYTPKAPAGATDDYHCTLLNPHVTSNSYIVSSQFFPGSPEDHHAILFLVPPSLATTAEADNTAGNGWSCFGESPIPGTGLDQISNTPWLSAWAPGHGEDDLPKGTGIYLPAGSLIVVQVHYNLLVGDSPVKNSMVLHTVPASTPLLPLKLSLMPAPPDIPCPTGVTGPLCTRSASLANLGQRFGQSAVDFVNTIEAVCGRNPANPPVGDSTSCDWPVGQSGYIVRAQAHMHLLGAGFKMVIDPGTPQAKTVLDVPDYNFHYQRAYNIKPIRVTAGDTVQVTCTYDPSLGQELPALRKLPPHFVTWGDGSSDEMCLGLMWTSASLPNANSSI
jgi:Copper type II ascorbate-dependent monooxygenase, C-terminal domain